MATGEIEIAPSAERVAEWRQQMAALAERRAEEARYAVAPAVTRCGRKILALVNLQGLADLTPEAAYADGVGLVRTEFLFEPGSGAARRGRAIRRLSPHSSNGRPDGR